MKDLKTWLKILLIALGSLFLLFCILIGVLVIRDFQMEGKLEKEIAEIEDILNSTDFDEEALKQKLNKSVTSGDYHKVERAYKNYVRDYIQINATIVEFYERMEKDLEGLLSEEHLLKDGKDFIETKTKLMKYQKELDTLKEKFDNLSNEKKVLSYLNSGVEDYYVDYFKELIGDIQQTEEEKELSSQLSRSSLLLETVRGLFDFLSTYQNHWEIQNNTLSFDSGELLKEYESWIARMNQIAEGEEVEESSI